MTEASEVGEARAVLQHWLDETPRYDGDDPRANHYRRNVRALETAIAALATPPPPVSEDYLRDIARKAYENGPPEGLTTGPDWEYLTDEMRESCIAFTRNVLAALANPTEKV